MGKVRFFGVGAKWKKQCETANFLVYYTKKDTGGLLNGVDPGLPLVVPGLTSELGPWSERRKSWTKQ